METDVEKHMQDIARGSRYAKSPYIHIVAGATAAALIAAKKNNTIAEGPRDASCQLKSCQLPRKSAKLLIRQVLTKSMV